MRRNSERGAKRDLRSSVGAALTEVRRYIAKIYSACVRNVDTPGNFAEFQKPNIQLHAKNFDRDSPLTQSICFLCEESTNWKCRARILVRVICERRFASKRNDA